MINLVIDPSFSFSDLERAFDADGWALMSAASQPILPGEPEHAAFERPNGDRAQYTFNPVCRFRVVEVGKQPDLATQRSLRVVGTDAIGEWLTSNDERTVLRGLLAARLNPDARHDARVAELTHHPRRAIADAALRASQAIRETLQTTIDDNSRTAALAFIRVIQEQADPILRALQRDRDGSIVAALRPRPEDYTRVFVRNAVDAARSAYETLWADAPRLDVPSANTELQSFVAPAGMLAYDNELSTHFPGGYRHIAHVLQPQRAWVRWTYTRPGASSGMSFDGLVWCDDHWVWFPKPFRVLADQATR